MNKTTNQASTLVKLTDELRALGVDTAFEDITGAVSFDANDGRHFVVGNVNGIIGADIYASRDSFERGDLPQGDWETASEDPAAVAKELRALAAPLKKGEEIRIKPEWQDKGDDKLKWFAYDDEENGRVGIYTPMPEMAIQPWQTVDAYMVERVERV
jgi:hypothetical protein